MKGIETANTNEAPRDRVEAHRPQADEVLQKRGFSLEDPATPEKIVALQETMKKLSVVDPETNLPVDNGNRYVVEALAAQRHIDEEALQKAADAAAAEHHQAGLDAFAAKYGVEIQPAEHPRSAAANDHYAPARQAS